MCSFQTLFQDNNTGYVVRCHECEKIQIGYGNLMLTLNEEGFEAFRHWLEKIRADQPADIRDTVCGITVPTACEGIRLLLSLRELLEFEDMLEAADTELLSLDLLKLFRNE